MYQWYKLQRANLGLKILCYLLYNNRKKEANFISRNKRETKMFAAENGLKGDPRLQAISEAIRVIPHFPKPGFSLLLFFCFLICCYVNLFNSQVKFFVCGWFLFWLIVGIMFQDITTLLLNHKAFKDTVDIFVDRYKDMGISVVAGIVSVSLYFVLHTCNFCLIQISIGVCSPSVKYKYADNCKKKKLLFIFS